jgi:Ino eighty subunit 1
MTEDEDVRTPGEAVREPPSKPATSTSRKRKEPPPGSAQNNSMYSGNKVKHLKKDDGEPLWRKDIQYEFLKAVFEDDRAVFTNSYEPDQIAKQTFANLYIDTMARSSKTSKILRDKLLTEHEPAKNMAMVCLLVNLGRMNTTLNCAYYPPHQYPSLTCYSLPGDASPASNIPCHPLLTSSSRPQFLQAAPGCAATQIDSQGSIGGPSGTKHTRKD